MIDDERAAEGIDHLQRAALELIGAARAFLDVAEDLVHDRDRVADVVATAASLAEVVAPDWATRRAGAARRADDPRDPGRPRAERPTTPPAGNGPQTRPKPTDRVQHIDIS